VVRGEWASLGVGVALIILVTYSTFKLLGAWASLTDELRKELKDIKGELKDISKENKELKGKLDE